MKSLMCFEEIGAGKPASGLRASGPAGADPAFRVLMQVIA